MDFGLDENEQAVADLATQILTDKVTPESLLALDEAIEEGDGEWFDRAAYAEIAKAGLVAIAVGEANGGGGLDLVAAGQVLRAQGSAVAPMPLLDNTVAAMALDRFDTEGAHRDLLGGICDGSANVSIAIQEYMNDRLLEPSTVFDGSTVSGTKIVVEFADVADALLVAAVDADSTPALVLIESPSASATLTAGTSTRLQPVWEVEFDNSPAHSIAEGPEAIRWLHDHLIAGICAAQLGVTEAALKLTAAYTSEREQFGRPIATFQAVTQRLADQYINVEGIRLTTANALWRLATGHDAEQDLRVAKYWASDRATEVANATQHCHGGMGVSVDYPLHRYTLWNKHLTTSLGAGTQQLRDLGASFAR